LLIENPKPSSPANVPISETGIAMSGMICRRRLEKDQDDEHDKRDCFEKRLLDLVN